MNTISSNRTIDRLSLIAKAGLLSLALFVTACSSGPEERTAGQIVDDATIATRVKAALARNDSTKARNINVEVNRGEVQLAGFVDSAAERSAAGDVARQVEGVRKVDNSLQIGGADRTAGQTLDDGMITAKVKSALIRDSRTKAYQIDVNTYSGAVQLAGFVDSRDAKAVAGEIAAAVEGVRDVRNNLEVK